ncbi:MAG: hypothetical protein R3C10_15115 [Pirellulales bacterium]
MTRFTRGHDGKYASAELVTVINGYDNEATIVDSLGPPEFVLRTPTFSMLDYAEQGARFIVDRDGRTIGTALFPHMRRRVHEGARQLVDLTHLREGPQPAPERPASVAGLSCGTDQRKLSPQPDWVDPRYAGRFTPHDDIWARTAVFEHGGETIALVGADLFGMSYSEVLPIKQQLADAGVDHFVLAMSHNHAAPDTIGVYGYFPERHIEFIQQQVVDSVLAAREAAVPVASLRGASRELPMDGARAIGYFRNARNTGLIDPTISLLQAVGEDGGVITTLVNFACHVEGIEMGVREMTADFPGYMCDQIARDGGGQAVFLNGAVGGMVSGDNRERTHEEAEVTGLGLAEIVAELAKTAQPPATFEFSARTRRIEIPVTNPRFKGLMGPDARRPTSRGRVVTEMSLITLGECQMLTLPGELLPEVSFEILEKMTGFPRMLIGLANDELGYIIPPDDFRDDEYEETMSVGPAAAPVIKETALRLLGE